MYKEWGPICWIFLHTIIEKMKKEYFDSKKGMLFEIIYIICSNLPCPNCKKHSINYLKNNKIRKCNTINDLRMYMFNFHNTVNIRLNKKIFESKDLEKYKNCRFNELIKRFNVVFKKQYLFTKTMDGWKRGKISEDIMTKIKSNLKYFNP
tara:strand:- start:6592 stop:7041 length:450 start_codon:yes stop_codon:yes gene_type:complete